MKTGQGLTKKPDFSVLTVPHPEARQGQTCLPPSCQAERESSACFLFEILKIFTLVGLELERGWCWGYVSPEVFPTMIPDSRVPVAPFWNPM
jgi:hypothetical protein